MSLRVFRAELGIKLSTIRNAFQEKLKIFPYMMSVLQLLQEDYPLQLH